ncbi:MAG: hypothetical protein KKF62_17110 [Bacteroidetes bacterium]|nr:hypothetical protein [Bacteroidota bacterium]MBU1797869.1 hypothetical protein [Bacteroidota bacterium]
MYRTFIFVLFLQLFASLLVAQVDPSIQAYRDEEYGDKTYRKKGIMDGNLVRTIFRNDGQVGAYPDRPSGEWPKGTGHNYLDGITPFISASVFAPGNSQFVHPAITSYREDVDFDPVTNQLWVVEPVPGYANASSEEPAISTKPLTWPEMWSRSLPSVDENWDGYWYGYFGRGVQNADFETFYVMDDSQDKEYSRPPYNYFPIKADSNRAGLGLRTEVRGFQWSHVLSEDIIFWHYDIVNLSDATYDTTYFGFYCDTGVGGLSDNGDDNASYDTKLDIAYAFDADGTALPENWKTGYVGYAFLESPGNALNGFDDDEDGMTDERRDDGIDNDGDWVPFLDLNLNGVWDAAENEPLNNDVGADGVGPYDIQYNGPDFGEGDGIPTDGEPNFDKTDKDESDQIGLTSLAIERLTNKGPDSIWPKNDEVIWETVNNSVFDTTLSNANIQILFGSGPFPLEVNRRERFSVAVVMGANLGDMIFNKETVQQIYNANYNFAKPPLKPTLTAIAGDKKVFLFWDDVAEQSRDPFLGYENDDPTQGFKKDFEGYLVYRSEDPEFNDIKIITDSKGDEKYWKPIQQYDLIDGIFGSDPVGINGAHFWRGDDSGLQHSFIDSNVVNGITYYYALVAYDQGDPDFGTTGLLPSENTKIITVDLVGNLKFVDINCAAITPNAPAAGYLPPQISGNLDQAEGTGTGSIQTVILDPNSIKNNANYKIVFNSKGDMPFYETVSYSIIRDYNSQIDTIESYVDTNSIGGGKLGPSFDGLSIIVNNHETVQVNLDETGWLVGYSNLYMPVKPDESNPLRNIAWPSDYIIEFLPERSVTTPFYGFAVPFFVVNATRGDTVDAEIIDNNKNDVFDLGDDIVIIEYVGTSYKLTWRIGYNHSTTAPIDAFPQAGNKFFIKTNKQFIDDDYFAFSTIAATTDKELANDQLNKIKVVPNPYVAVASWETRNLNQEGRGNRRIDFIHLPAKCTVRIYTLTGALIKTLNKDSGSDNGAISWNLVTEDGTDIAYGLYIYHIDAPEIGTHVGKFAVIK